MTVKINDIEAKREILNTKFHQYFFITLSEDFLDTNDKYTLSDAQTVNVVIPFEKILDTDSGYGLSHLLQYFNKDFSNVLITHADNFNVIHQCEVYKNTFFIKLQPYTQTIALHIISQTYDATDNILFFKDEFIEDDKYQYTVQNTSYYKIYKDKNHKNINLYFQSHEKNAQRPTPTITLSAPQVVEINTPFEFYGVLNVKEIRTVYWDIPLEAQSGHVVTNENGEFTIEIDKLTQEQPYQIVCSCNEDDRYKATTKTITVYVNDIGPENDSVPAIDINTINYVQSSYGDRNAIMKPYPMFSQFSPSSGIYYRYTKTQQGETTVYTWTKDTYERHFGEFEFDISKRNVTNPQNTQINVGYRYNNSSPQNAIHYIGVKDKTNLNAANKCTLIDTNFDKITQKSNVIEQFDLDRNDNLIFPKTPSPLNAGFTHESGLHSDNIGKLYHKTIKYFNDDMYVEEFDGENIEYMSQEWHDEDED